MTGRCFDLTETPPYGPWLDLFARAPRAARPAPALLAALAGAGTAGATGQAALFGRVREALTAAAARQPMLLVLDDLHWADPASLELLRALAREVAALPMLLLAVYRTEEVSRHHPLFSLLPALVREAAAARLDLRALDDGAVRALLRARYALAAPDESQLVAYLRARAEGNPFFAGELLRTLEEAGLLRAAGGGGWALGDLAGAGVPPLLRQVLEGRLGRLGEPARALLAVAAVIGQEVPLALWAAVAGAGEGALLDAVERAVPAHLLAAAADGTRVRFVHALVREALYESVLPPRRRGWHRSVAEALLAGRAADPDAVAFHFQRAGDPRAVGWLLAACDRADRAYAWLSAAERAEAALALLERQGADAAERGWLCLRLARLRRYGDQRQALGHAERAAALGRESGDRGLAAHSLSTVGLLRCHDGHLRAGLAAFAAGEAARDALTPAARAQFDGRLAATGVAPRPHRGPSTLAIWLTVPGRYAEAATLARRLLATAPATEEPAGAHLRFALGAVAANLGDPAEGARWYAEARARSRASGNHWELGQFAFQELLALHLPYRADHPDEREGLAAEAAEGWGRAGGLLRAAASVDLAHLPLLILAGAWDAAWDLALATRAGAGMNVPLVLSLLGPLALARGEHDLARELVREVLPAGPATEPGDSQFPTAAALQRAAARLALDAGDLPGARAWLEAHDRWHAWSGAVPGRAPGHLGWAAHHRAAGKPEVAWGHAERALALASAPRQPLALLDAHRTLGELATAAGRTAEADRHLAAALALADACAAPYERALTLLAQAELRAAAGDRPAATTLLAEARAGCARLGAAPALARAGALAARLATAPDAPAPYPAGLTPREVEVLRLLAGGASNRAIAAALVLSPHTVERHVANLYAKTGAHGRAAATAFALRHHLA